MSAEHTDTAPRTPTGPRAFDRDRLSPNRGEPSRLAGAMTAWEILFVDHPNDPFDVAVDVLGFVAASPRYSALLRWKSRTLSAEETHVQAIMQATRLAPDGARVVVRVASPRLAGTLRAIAEDRSGCTDSIALRTWRGESRRLDLRVEYGNPRASKRWFRLLQCLKEDSALPVATLPAIK